MRFVRTQRLHCHMPKYQTYILRQLHVVDVSANRMLSYLFEPAAVVAANAQANSTVLIGVMNRPQNVFRIPAARNSDNKITFV